MLKVAKDRTADRTGGTAVAPPAAGFKRAAHAEVSKERLAELFAMYCSIDNRPFNATEGKGFVALVRALAPEADIPRRNMVRQQLDTLVTRARDKLIGRLGDAVAVSFTTDFWARGARPGPQAACEARSHGQSTADGRGGVCADGGPRRRPRHRARRH